MRKLEHELNQFKIDGVIPFERFMDSINLFFTDDAVEWAETNMNAMRLLGNEELIAEIVFSFRILFQERFFAKIVEFPAVTFHIELDDFRQNSDEIIDAYHQRLLNLMFKIIVRDRPTTEKLSLLKKTTLRKITKAFAKNLLDEDVRRETIRDLIISDRFLRELFLIAENADRSKRKMKKIMEKKNRVMKLEFYRDFVAKATSRERIESMLAQYRAGSRDSLDSPFDRPMTAPLATH